MKQRRPEELNQTGTRGRTLPPDDVEVAHQSCAHALVERGEPAQAVLLVNGVACPEAVPNEIKNVAAVLVAFLGQCDEALTE